jgi:vitamin B12 transporter
MKKKILFAAAVVCSSVVLAQQDSTKNLDEVVVTATKFPLKTSATGKVLTVITKEQLQKAGGKDLAQLLSDETGIIINGYNSNAGKDKNLYLRGARIEHTLITIDGVPVYDASGIGGNFDIRNFAITNVERIEILKGSQSTLYGSDAIAGVINIITTAPANKKIAVNGLLSGGSFGSIRNNINISGAQNKIDYSVNYSYAGTDGISEATIKNGSFDRDGFKQQSMQAKLGIQATSNFKISPYIRYTQSKGDIDQGAFTDEADYAYTQKSMQAGVRSTLAIKKTQLSFTYNYNTINREYIDDSVKSRNGFYTYSQGLYKGAEHFIEALGVSKLSSVVTVSYGIDFRSSISDQEYNPVGFFAFPSKLSKDSLQQNQTGFFAAVNFETKSGFSIEAGNRLNIHSAYGSNYVFNINPSYLINKQVKLFANLSSGYRTPSLYQLYSEYGNKKLNPESSISVEGGVQYLALNKKFNTRAVVFSRNVKDAITFGPAFTYINQDKQKDYGVELDATYTGIKNTTLRFFYNYIDGNITTKVSATKDTTFNNLLRRPQNNYGFIASTVIAKRLFVSANLSVFSKRRDAYFDNNSFSTVNVTLSTYALLNIYADYGFLKNRLKLFVDARNVNDAVYNESAGYNTLRSNFTTGIRFNF